MDRLLLCQQHENYIENEQKNNKNINCRMNNHHLSAERVEVKGSRSCRHNSKYDIAYQCILLVACHDCNLEWKEIWRTSRWFIAKDSQDNEK
jgi:hypothetical protein